jgi:hypothetical protein
MVNTMTAYPFADVSMTISMITLQSRKTTRVLMRSAIESVRCRYFKADDEGPESWDIRIGMISGKTYTIICHETAEANMLMEKLTGAPIASAELA